MSFLLKEYLIMLRNWLLLQEIQSQRAIAQNEHISAKHVVSVTKIFDYSAEYVIVQRN